MTERNGGLDIFEQVMVFFKSYRIIIVSSRIKHIIIFIVNPHIFRI